MSKCNINTRSRREEEKIEIQTETNTNTIFGRFVIAHIAEDYLKGTEQHSIRPLLFMLLHMRYDLIPRHEMKEVSPESNYIRNYRKYCREITTKRGIINCIAREIPCECVEEKRIEAKSMEKVAMCFCCQEEFLKEKMLRCKGCDHDQY